MYTILFLNVITFVLDAGTILKTFNGGGYNMNTDDTGYLELQIAIINQANEDYQTALFENKKRKIEELERFYLSTWGQLLTDYNGENIISRIRREVKK